MMKRIIAAAMIVFLVLPGFAAAAPGGHGAPAGEEHTAPWGEHRMNDEGNAQIAENETPGLDQNRMEKRDQNQVRLAVHTLLAAENRTGGIGRNISVIAREFNNSVKKTLEAEEQIRGRHGFVRFLFGGDEDAARLIAEEAQRNRERVTELGQSIENCTCDNETREMLREQVRTIEQEQDRLRALAEEELQHRGLFGWT